MSAGFPIPSSGDHVGGQVPLTASDLTPAWLSAALRADPALAGRTPTTLAATQVAESAISRVFTLDLTWADGGAPATLIAKLPAATPEGRATIFARRMTRREQRFYDVLAPRTPLHVPAAHALLGDDDTGRALVLEDLGASGFLVPPAQRGLSPSAAGNLLEAIAALHARWWQGPRLSELTNADWLYDYATRGLDIDDTTQLPIHWSALQDAGLVPEPAHEPGSTLCRDIDTLTAHFLTLPTTIIHGDLHLENVCLRTPPARPQDPSDTAFIDWQHTARGPAVYDLAKLLCTGIEPPALSTHLPALLTRYHTALTTAGVDYPLPTLHQDLNLALRIVVATDIGDGHATTTLSPWTRRLLANLPLPTFQSI